MLVQQVDIETPLLTYDIDEFSSVKSYTGEDDQFSSVKSDNLGEEYSIKSVSESDICELDLLK